MAYNKHVFKKGQVVTSEQLNRMENQIALNERRIDGKIDIADACDRFEVTGNPAVCYPVKGTELGLKLDIPPVQEGAGTASPENAKPIVVPDGQVTIDGVTLPLALPDNFCGGTVDLGKGTVSEEWGITTVDGVNIRFSEKSGYFNTANGTFPNNSGGSYASEDILCSHFYQKFSLNKANSFVAVNKTNIADYFASADELNEFAKQQFANGTPLTFYYKLATPNVTPIAPIIPTAKGVTTITANASSVTVSGYEDPKHSRDILRQQLTALTALALEG